MSRWPIIRHIRCLYLTWRVYRFANAWNSLGIGFGAPAASDLQHLRRIWRGEE